MQLIAEAKAGDPKLLDFTGSIQIKGLKQENRIKVRPLSFLLFSPNVSVTARDETAKQGK